MKNRLTHIIFVLLMLAAGIAQAQQNIFTVTRTDDPSPFLYQQNPNDPAIIGTLQWAVRKANDATGTILINFNIPGNGPHIINLNYYLPDINNNNIVIDGSTQPGYQTGNPAIIIDGQTIISNCFIIHDQQCEIKGLYIRKFNTGISVLSPYFKIDNNVINQCNLGISISSNYGEVTGNIIGTDNTMTGLLYISGYGIFIGYTLNNITENIIAYCQYAGIMVTYINSQNLFSQNQIFNNPRAIVYKATPPVLKPIISSIINGNVSGTSQPNCRIEIFGSTGNENANEYLSFVTADASGNWTANVTTTYPYIVATAIDQNNNTSVLSAAFAVPAPTPGSTCAAAIEIQIN
ncbi:MAG: hypothetical protein HY958_10655 [Bacteroidia bacterium]|nr:hypothetical protein [Bacteroidia bacterium]